MDETHLVPGRGARRPQCRVPDITNRQPSRLKSGRAHPHRTFCTRKEARVIHHRRLPVHTSTSNGGVIGARSPRARQDRAIARSRYGALSQGDALPPPLDLGRRTGQCPPAAPFTPGRRPPATDGYAAACSRRALSIARCGRRIRPQSRLQRIQIHAPRRHRDRHAPLAWPRRCRSNRLSKPIL